MVVCCDWVLMRIIYRFHTSIYGKLKRRVLLCVCVCSGSQCHISPENSPVSEHATRAWSCAEITHAHGAHRATEGMRVVRCMPRRWFPTNERLGCCTERHNTVPSSSEPVQALRVRDKEASSPQDWSPCLMPIHADTFSFHSHRHTHTQNTSSSQRLPVLIGGIP